MITELRSKGDKELTGQEVGAEFQSRENTCVGPLGRNKGVRLEGFWDDKVNES